MKKMLHFQPFIKNGSILSPFIKNGFKLSRFYQTTQFLATLQTAQCPAILYKSAPLRAVLKKKTASISSPFIKKGLQFLKFKITQFIMIQTIYTKNKSNIYNHNTQRRETKPNRPNAIEVN
jgi:hypothetical protein